MEKIDIVLDFDGTVVSHDYPRVGGDIGAIPVLRKILENGHNLILFTMRPGGKGLSDAVNWFKENDIKLYGIQRNPMQHWTNSPKAQGDLIIDDTCLGIPLKKDPNHPDRTRFCVDWVEVEKLLIERKVIK